ncbi:MAG: GNAT family N-acetyltransferase [bacterium]|nr:GNAT family N-acetyltransferase [bacterium]
MAFLVRPSEQYRESFTEAVKEFYAEEGEYHINLSEIQDHFSGFLQRIENWEKGIDLPEGYVPATVLWLVDDDEYIGRVSIRHRLTDELLRGGGHIGYDIRPTKRKRGYGTKILALSLPEARRLGIKKALLTCDDDNTASAKIIEKNGGVMENRADFHGKLKRRYWISLG